MLKDRKEHSTHMELGMMLWALILGGRQFTAPLSLLSAPECSCVTTVPLKISLRGCETGHGQLQKRLSGIMKILQAGKNPTVLSCVHKELCFLVPQQHSLSRECPQAVWQEEGSTPSQHRYAASSGAALPRCLCPQ